MLQADRSTWTGRGLSVLGGLSWCVVPGWSPNGNVAGESIQATKQSSRVAHTHSAFIFETLASLSKNVKGKCFPNPNTKAVRMNLGSGELEQGGGIEDRPVAEMYWKAEGTNRKIEALDVQLSTVDADR
ncbi:hypothetical protein N7475_009190 [Penicillium sp. IBT 31633x]|nr:hypothetical protein N7475_009190 [Penicillium sp. IBT 31633x]